MSLEVSLNNISELLEGSDLRPFSGRQAKEAFSDNLSFRPSLLQVGSDGMILEGQALSSKARALSSEAQALISEAAAGFHPAANP